MNILIIGAGVSGLTAARILQDSGHNVLVVDKGRGVGGRMATRRIGDAVFDHGAQFLTARTEWFTETVRSLHSSGIIVPWFAGGHDDSHVRFCGAVSMNAIAKYLSQGLDIRTSTTVESIRQIDDRWYVTFDTSETLSCDSCLVTAPIPQALALVEQRELDLRPDELDRLKRISYDPCFAVMAVLDSPSGLPTGGPFRPDDTHSIALISDNQAKGISPLACVTIHSTPECALRHIEDPELAGSIMREEAMKHLRSNITSSTIHRWRYAQPSTVFEAPFSILNNTPLLLLAGDAFGGARIEGAALSGKAAADHILGL